MKKEDILTVAHLLTAMKDAADKLEESQKRKDSENITKAKKEIIALQSQINSLI